MCVRRIFIFIRGAAKRLCTGPRYMMSQTDRQTDRRNTVPIARLLVRSAKNCAPVICVVTLANVGQFLKFSHPQNHIDVVDFVSYLSTSM